MVLAYHDSNMLSLLLEVHMERLLIVGYFHPHTLLHNTKDMIQRIGTLLIPHPFWIFPHQLSYGPYIITYFWMEFGHVHQLAMQLL